MMYIILLQPMLLKEYLRGTEVDTYLLSGAPAGENVGDNTSEGEGRRVLYGVNVFMKTSGKRNNNQIGK